MEIRLSDSHFSMATSLSYTPPHSMTAGSLCLYFASNIILLIHVHNKPLFHLNSSANDVEAIDEESFYFTNYLYSTNSLLKIIELYMPMTWGSVFYWKEAHRPQLVINKLKQPNGITMSPDQK